MMQLLRNSLGAVPADHRAPFRASGQRKPMGVATSWEPSLATPKLSLNNVSLGYATNSGGRLVALKNINLQVQLGEFLCIVGPSGCGKSTLLHLIAGLHQPSCGHVLVDDKLVDAPGTDRILIFQELGLFPWLTVGENVEFGMKMTHVPKSEREEKIRYYLRL